MTRDELLAMYDRMVAAGWEPETGLSGTGHHDPPPGYAQEQRWLITWRRKVAK